MVKENVVNFLSAIPETNRYGEKITVVGAVKTMPADVIAEAVSAGLCDIGENRVSEFIEKSGSYPKNATLHFIGHLQTNKLKYIIGKTSLIQSCDSEKLAKKISDAAIGAGITQNVLLEVNVGREPQKYGFLPENLSDAYQTIKRLPSIRICGLMTVLPKASEKDLEPLCAKMRGLFDEIKRNDEDFVHLSMGMSEDYAVALKYGSNMLRIGRAIFGERNYNDL